MMFLCAGSTTPSLFEHERVAARNQCQMRHNMIFRETLGEKYLHTIYLRYEVLKEHNTYSMLHLHRRSFMWTVYTVIYTLVIQYP